MLATPKATHQQKEPPEPPQKNSKQNTTPAPATYIHSDTEGTETDFLALIKQIKEELYTERERNKTREYNLKRENTILEKMLGIRQDN